MRKLASIQTIGKIIPIPKKDRIVQVMVNGWSVIAAKGDFQEGDKCVFFEIDSVLPDIPQFEIINKRSPRLKTMKMGGVLSQGLVINIDQAKCAALLIGNIFPTEIPVGTDLTEVLGVKKWEEKGDDGLRVQAKKTLWQRIKGLFTKEYDDSFPTYLGISKTDEERVQNLMSNVEAWNEMKLPFIRTLKMDGQSTTWVVNYKHGIFFDKVEHIMCTRNRSIWPGDTEYERFKEIADRSKVFEELYRIKNNAYLFGINGTVDFVAFQAELCGPKIQNNRVGLLKTKLYVFNILIGVNGKVIKLNPHEVEDKLLYQKDVRFGNTHLRVVPMIDDRPRLLPNSIDDFYKEAKEHCFYAHNLLGEGIVYRNYDREISFKYVNPDYLMKHGL